MSDLVGSVSLQSSIFNPSLSAAAAAAASTGNVPTTTHSALLAPQFDHKELTIAWPKHVTELHVHLGGSVPLYRLWEIAIDRGIRGIGSGYEEFVSLLKIEGGKVRDLDSYLEVYDKIELIQSGPASVRESIIIAIHRAYRTGGMVKLGPGGEGGSPEALFAIGRLEIRWNPMKRTGAVFLKGSHAGLYDVDRVIKAGVNAVEEVEIGFHDQIQVGHIFCFGRDMTFEANMALARKTRLWRERTKKIIGIDLAGHESVNPLSSPRKLEEMRIVFDEAGPGLGRTVHVGETPHVDIETFIRTIEVLNPVRVGHPISAVRALWNDKDDRGMKLLQERGIVCELCVKSNLLTGAVKDIQEYGRFINTLDDFGIGYTFSTDAPSLQGTSLAEELLMLLSAGAATPDQVLRALKTAETASFLPPELPR
jgi:adenosine deaminase